MSVSKNLVVGAIVLLAGTAGMLVAGPLNPPAGGVASTFKTMGEVEPRIAINSTNTPGDADSVFRISQPGSYYLTGNISTATSKAAIEVAASHVTIDLMGFVISGASAAGDYDGVRNSSALVSVTVRNGTIDQVGDDGIDLTSSSLCTVENMTINNAGVRGVTMGSRAVVRNCRIASSGSHGIWVGGDSRVENSSSCTSDSASGIVSNGAGTRIVGCIANNNAMNGFSLNYYNTLEDSRADENTINGILAQAGCMVRDNGVAGNGSVGILVDGGGINHILGNRVQFNGSSGATGAGIRVTAASGTHNTIEDNTVIQNPRGIDLLNNLNLVRRNFVGVNTVNFNFVSGNRVAPIVVAPASGANSAGGLGTTDPNANIAY